MILRRLRAINWNKNGFTLAELLIAMAITALIGSAVATATSQLVKVNALSINHQNAVSQVQNAVNSISRDAQQAQQVLPIGPTVVNDIPNNIISFNLITDDTFTVQWIDWNDNTTQQAVYTVETGTLKKNNITVANNISIASGSWNTYTRTLTFYIEAAVGASNTSRETRTFQIIPRPAQ